MLESPDIRFIQLAGFCVGTLVAMVASIAAIKNGTESRLLGSNALSIFLYGAGLAVLIAGHMFGSAHVLIEGGLLFLFFGMFLFGYSIEKKWRKSQNSA